MANDGVGRGNDRCGRQRIIKTGRQKSLSRPINAVNPIYHVVKELSSGGGLFVSLFCFLVSECS